MPCGALLGRRPAQRGTLSLRELHAATKSQGRQCITRVDLTFTAAPQWSQVFFLMVRVDLAAAVSGGLKGRDQGWAGWAEAPRQSQRSPPMPVSVEPEKQLYVRLEDRHAEASCADTVPISLLADPWFRRCVY